MKEWHLIGDLFDAETAEQHNPINRLTTPERPDAEVQALIEVLLEKNPRTLERTKKCLNYGADNVAVGLALESEWIGRYPTEGIADFPIRERLKERRKLSNTFWQN